MSDLEAPADAVAEIVERALAEDLGPDGDLTTVAIVAPEIRAEAAFVARQDGVLSGTAPAAEAFRQVDPGIEVAWSAADGDVVAVGARFGVAAGSLASMLTAERTALNFLTHCSGIATLTRRFVDAAGPACMVLDTRKTLPGLRAIERAAVRAGGARNHRGSLSEAVLIKDNHLAFATVTEAVERARRRWPGRFVEVECDSLDQVAEAKTVGPDRVLLDNMTPAEVRAAVAVLGGSVPAEVSGGVSLATVAAYAAAGADFVSVGALTHSAPALDIAFDIQPIIASET